MRRFFSLLFAFLGVLLCSVANGNAETTTKPEKTIRYITIEVRPIFDDQNLNSFYRTVNDLKISTVEDVVRREVLIKEGDTYDPFLVEESKRNLRSLSFLRHAEITAVPDGEFVDLFVSVQDTWTLFPQFSFNLTGSTKKQSFGLAEKNLLGFGKRVEVLYADDEGREKVEGIYDDTRFLGTYQRLLVAGFNRSDGDRVLVNYGRPFRTLTERYAWGVNTEFFNLVGRLFDAGDERFIFRQERIFANARFTFSSGDPEVKRRRYTVGYEYQKDRFAEADAEDFQDADVDPNTVNQDPALLAEDREFSGPFLAYEEIVPDYLSLAYIDRFERVEDFNLGREWRFKFGFAGKAFGSNEDTGLFALNVRDGIRLGEGSFLRGRIGGTGRINSEGIDNVIASFDLKYYNVLGPKMFQGIYLGDHTLAAAFTLNYGEDLDKDVEFLLGSSTGLRGYEDRAFSGDILMRLNLEDRIHLFEDVFKLFSLGGAIFLDVGGASRESIGDILSDELYADAGVGLRIGFPRFAGSTVVRVDLAYPLRDARDGTEAYSPELTVTLGQAFSARLRGESSSGATQDVSLGFSP